MDIVHGVVHYEPGKFSGWPANGGIWQWKHEILIKFDTGHYLEKPNKHSFNENYPMEASMARSMDGGTSWKLESTELPPFFVLDKSLDMTANTATTPIDFHHSDFALWVNGSGFYYSYNRGKTWEGPYKLDIPGISGKMTSRTDYMVSPNGCVFFLSASDARVSAGSYKDRSFCAETVDGGKTFSLVSWITHEPYHVRAVMSSTVRADEHLWVSAIRRRSGAACWIDAYGSADSGRTWTFLSKVADTEDGATPHNGNPPSIVKLPDGRLCVIYGFRGAPCGIRAKISADGGQTWSEEHVLRDDAVSWDLGYPKSVVRPDGSVLITYYYATQDRKEPHIAYSLWNVPS